MPNETVAAGGAPPEQDADAASAPVSHRRARFGALVRRHRLALTVTAGALAVLLLGTGAVAAGALAGQPASLARGQGAAPAKPETRALPAEPPAAGRVRSCTVADRAADPRLAQMQAQVRNATTGEVLFDRGGTTASRTASTLKILTAAAALSVLGPDFRATTRVVKGEEPGSAVLVGGGDVTLSRTPSGNETVYPGAAHLDELARQVRDAWAADPSNPPLTTLILDAGYFGGDAWHASWDPAEREFGYMPLITALQVDGDRDDPYSNTSYRSTDPVARAGDAFAAELGGIAVIERGTAPADARLLGEVASPSVAELVDKALIVSDNAVAEMLARLVAIRTGTGNDFAAIHAGVLEGLAAYGVEPGDIAIVDGSGLSDDNAVQPDFLTRFLLKVHAREAGLGYVFDSLPVARGPRGSLSYSDRFVGDNAVAAGAVFAKTGWIETGYTLAGIIHAADGTPLTFAVYALGDVGEDAKQGIDSLTTGFYLCGDNLANW